MARFSSTGSSIIIPRGRLRPKSRRRHILPLLALLLLFSIAYFLHSSSSSSSSPPSAAHAVSEFAWLQHHMNSPFPSQRRNLVSNTSFDWSSIPYKYPPPFPLRVLPLPSGFPISLPPIQHHFGPESRTARHIRESRRQQVKQVFIKNWKSYRERAWKKDALLPISGGYKDQFSGWAATLVDALDTLWIMGLRSEFDEAVAAVAEIDFGVVQEGSGNRVNTFETNIRYLGGLLGAYDLSHRDILLIKAREILSGPRREKKGLEVEETVVSASPGTLTLEMTRLAQVMGDMQYYDAAARVMDVFERGQNRTKIPGLWPVYVSMARQDVVPTSGNQFGVAGGADSLYEYLPKMYALTGGLETRPMVPGNEDVLMIGTADVMINKNGKEEVVLNPESEHLGCFVGGVYGLGGRLFGRPEWVENQGIKITKGCVYAYRAMPTGMMPERYNMVPCPSRDDVSCWWNEDVWKREKKKRLEWKQHLPKGFTTAKDPRYILRPEAIESVFVMWRITGRQEFQEAAWDMFTAVSNATETEFANAAVLDVTKAEYPLPKEDYMESFWLAETLKYFYLVFSPPDVISLDDFVLNTEAHPFRRPKKPRVDRPLKM
ncbi:glycoside hydrolase family 47 protein [Neurospora crassa]|uniref:alpha-1,2-Mannosidase n=1 Tax=Neurospora crassa (strain ATCC 24698 / 74-OR23-1A / CBS 708.71 / DSM 1257 / FGSC 987) TaxID=367110 RepID=Q7S2U7_NEUCR|nr:class I alpha-mannosidase [Neurospora crassa OR74A]EAA29739.2 class I alpha-mannosidase [Neurospora crassa OR74A]KHE86154.1 glycoside hydrolase family 47 protein [Neurospora crassa]|eukprot:XP_958975.2 class I alpha-mannosidase [Neurospora crassa OR74A]